MYKSRITRQGRTTIPKDLREKYALTIGNEIIYIDLGDKILLLTKTNSIKTLKGIQIDTVKTFEEIKQEILDTATSEATQS